MPLKKTPKDLQAPTIRKNDLSQSIKAAGFDIMSEMKDKITSLKMPKGFAKVVVLFHLSGVAPAVATSSCFYRIVDMLDFLEDN